MLNNQCVVSAPDFRYKAGVAAPFNRGKTRCNSRRQKSSSQRNSQ